MYNLRKKWYLPILAGMGFMQFATTTKAETQYDFNGHVWINLSIHPGSSVLGAIEHSAPFQAVEHFISKEAPTTEHLALNLLSQLEKDIPGFKMLPTKTINQTIASVAPKALSDISHYALDHFAIPVPVSIQNVPVLETPQQDGSKLLTFTVQHGVSFAGSNVEVDLPFIGHIDSTGKNITLTAQGVNFNLNVGKKKLMVQQSQHASAAGTGQVAGSASQSSTVDETTAPFVVNAHVHLGHFLDKFFHPNIGSATVTVSSWSLTPVAQPVVSQPASSQSVPAPKPSSAPSSSSSSSSQQAPPSSEGHTS